MLGESHMLRGTVSALPQLGNETPYATLEHVSSAAHGHVDSTGGAAMFMDSSYLMLIIVTMVLGFAAQGWISHAYKKYSRVANGTGMTGRQIARRMLDDNGLTNVTIKRVSGTLSDHYDPRSRSIALSDGIYDTASVSAMAVACHECGHAVQHARHYAPMSIRSALVPIANFGSSAWLILIIAGVFLNWMGLIWLAIALYAFAVLFHVVTLPVELNASRRGMGYIRGNDTGVVASHMALAPEGSDVARGARKVLTAAAMTYVVGALTSIMELLYYIHIFAGRD